MRRTDDETEENHVHVHALVLHLGRYGLGPGPQAGFATSVRRGEGGRDPPVERADIEDERVGFARDHGGEDEAGEVECP